MTSPDAEQIEKLLDMKLTDYVHDELNKPFARLLNFSKTYETLAADISLENSSEEAEVKPLGRSALKEGE